MTAAERLKKALQTPASLMGGESFIIHIGDVRGVVAERDELIKALEFYRDGFKAKVPKKPRYPGDVPSITYEPTEALLDDCGNLALSILAKVQS